MVTDDARGRRKASASQGNLACKSYASRQTVSSLRLLWKTSGPEKRCRRKLAAGV
jgi:hypothetical protein